MQAAILRQEILQALEKHGCLNSIEVCRAINGRALDDYKFCYPRGDFAFKTRPERCLGRGNHCIPWSLTVYTQLRELERRRHIESRLTRFWDKGNNQSFKHTDLFRFWFIDQAAYEKRVLRHTLMVYMSARAGACKTC